MRVSTLLIGLIAGTMLSATLHAQDWDHDRSVLNGLEDQLGQLQPNGSYLGVKLVEIDADRARTLNLSEERGVEVTGVEEGSPAENAGIKKGDVLLNYNGENVLGVQQFVRLVQETPQGRKVRIQLWRDGKSQTVYVTTGTRKAHLLGTPPNFVGFTMPDVDISPVWDTPNILMVWRNSLFGIECESVDSQLAQYFGVKRGVLVRSVERGSAAERAGVKAGDVLTAIGDKTVATAHDMTSYVRSDRQPGRPIPVTLVRDHKELTLSIVPADMQR